MADRLGEYVRRLAVKDWYAGDTAPEIAVRRGVAVATVHRLVKALEERVDAVLASERPERAQSQVTGASAKGCGETRNT